MLLWLENLSDVKVERREEYFCLLRTLVAVPDIRRVIVSKPIRLIDTIFNLIHKVNCNIRFVVSVVSNLPCDICFELIAARSYCDVYW